MDTFTNQIQNVYCEGQMDNFRLSGVSLSPLSLTEHIYAWREKKAELVMEFFPSIVIYLLYSFLFSSSAWLYINYH